jgi:hypothetical protein
VKITVLANHTTNAAATMNAPERLTWDEICQRYPDEWVVLVKIQALDEAPDPDETDDEEEMDEMDDTCRAPIEECTAVVVAHGNNRKCLSPEIKALQTHHPGLGAFFTGRLIPPAYELLVP